MKPHRTLAKLKDFSIDFVESLPVIVYLAEPQSPYVPVYISSAVEAFGYTVSEWLARPDLWKEMIHPDDRQRVLRETEKAFAGRDDHACEYRLVAKDGKTFWVSDRGRFVQQDGKSLYRQGVMLDIAPYQCAAEQPPESREDYRQIIEHASDIIYRTDAAGRFTFVNPTVLRTLKYTATELLELDYLKIVHPDCRRRAKRFYARQLTEKTAESYLEIQTVAKDGQLVWLGQHAQLLIEAGAVAGFQAIARDITKHKQTEDKLRELSLTDELTGLYNRRGFFALGEHQLKLAVNKRLENKLLIFYIDLDGLKQINDRFGHEAGSQAICAAAHLLKRSFRQSDLVARLGGDEFVVMAIEAETESTKPMLDRLMTNLARHNAAPTAPYRLELSIGSARFNPDQDRTIDDVINRADRAMYRRKKHRKKQQS